MNIRPVILSGGSGTRLWPLSRAAYPKQLMPLVGQESLLQETVERVSDPTLFSAPSAHLQRRASFSGRRAAPRPGLQARGDRARAAGPQHGPGGRGGGDDGRARQPAADPALGPLHPGCRGLPQRGQAGGQGGGGGIAGHLRHRAPRAGDGLWLYPAWRGPAGCAGLPQGGGLRREAGCRDGRGLSRLGRVSVERRHVPLPRRSLPRRARPSGAGDEGGGGEIRRQPPRAISISSAWTRRPSAKRRPSPSTMP